MENLKEQLQELLEVEELDSTMKFTDLDEWDSLASLSIIALLDSDYGITMKHSDIKSFDSIEDFCKYVMENKQ